jgi:hypothetical protein
MDDPGTRIELMGPARDELSFLADAVMPAQFYSARRGAVAAEPVTRLMAGVLVDAVRSFQRNFDAHRSDRRQEFREVQSWIFDNKGTGPFSFLCVCDSIEVDPGVLRNWIVRWQRDRRAGAKRQMFRRAPVMVAGRIQSRRGRDDRRDSLWRIGETQDRRATAGK